MSLAACGFYLADIEQLFTVRGTIVLIFGVSLAAVVFTYRILSSYLQYEAL